jgi:ElaB/YqjD/DUF883 family membrane-anchored ribosome-binding protein
MAENMAEPMRKPEPLPNQQPETDEAFREYGARATTAAVFDGQRELPPAATQEPPLGRVVEWRKAAEKKLEQVKESASEVAEQAASRAGTMYSEAEENIARAYGEGRDQAAKAIRRARRRARFYAETYPLQVIAAVAGAGFVVGALVRIWRSRRYE